METNRTSSHWILQSARVSVALAGLVFLLATATSASSQVTRGAIAVDTEAELRAAWADPQRTAIELRKDIALHACKTGDPIRESSRPMTLDGNGHTIRQTCFEKRLLRQDGTGYLLLKNLTLTRGGADGPGAAVTTRGEITIVDSRVVQNLAEEPGGGVFSMRRATIIRSVFTGNLANDDGGAVYARRGGVRVYDSTLSSNLVDGSGGAIGSTGDILVVRSHIDGNTTDGDGGALYSDEDGDITVIDSTVDGNTADGPGGAIFTLEGDVTIINSTLNGNRADDRGGAISGEADVVVVNSTIARNAAVAHVGGGIWSRGNLYVANSTISNNYAEGQGGGILAAGNLKLVNSTVVENLAPVAANIGAGAGFEAFGSVIGPALTAVNGGQAQPTQRNCQVSAPRSLGFNLVSDSSCGLSGPGDIVAAGDPRLAELRQGGSPTMVSRPTGGDTFLSLPTIGGLGETRMPMAGSPAVDRIPAAICVAPPLFLFLEGEQHLDGLVDLRTLARGDQRGAPRPQGTGCDIGAVETGGGQ